MLLDLKERKNPFSSQSFMFDKRVVNFFGTEAGSGEYFADIRYQRIFPTSRNTPLQCELASDLSIVGPPM